ncbi:MAG: class I SAM-dependent methyltransferase [Acidiferrobacter sp.]
MNHEQDVTRQFDSVAAHYETSPIHAHGPDLPLFRATAESLRPRHALDVGCGPGHVALVLAPFCETVQAVDASLAMVKIASARAQDAACTNIVCQQAAVASLPFADASMDLVTCRFSAHHWRNLSSGLQEIARVLRPGGTFILTDSVAPDDPLSDTHLQTIELLRDTSHVRNLTVSAWMALLAAYDFIPTRTDHFRIFIAFDDWVARAKTPATRVAALKDLLRHAPIEARNRLGIEEDGSFHLDVLTAHCQKART